jgi:hypothetical protein
LSAVAIAKNYPKPNLRLVPARAPGHRKVIATRAKFVAVCAKIIMFISTFANLVIDPVYM